MASPPRHPAYQYPGDVERLGSALMSLHERKLERERQARLDARQAELDRLAQEELARQNRMKEDLYQIELGKLQQDIAKQTEMVPGGKVKIEPQKVTLEEPPLPAELRPTGGMTPEELAVHEATGEPAPQKMELPLGPGMEEQAPDVLPFGRTAPVRLSSGETLPFPLQYKQEAEAEERRKMLMHPTIQAALIRAMTPRTGQTPAVGSFEDYVTQMFGERPTADQMAKARRDWAAMAREPKAGPAPTDISGFVDDFASGYGVLTDVPMALRDEVKALAKKQSVHVPTRKLSEKAIGELTDLQGLISKTGDLASLESSYAFAIPQWTPDFIRGYLAENTNSKFYKTAMQYEPVYFLYAAETLKSMQGSRPSDFDMQTYLANLPKLTDPPEVKRTKVERLSKQLVGKYNLKLDTYRKQGFNVGGFEPAAEMKPEPATGGSPTPTHRYVPGQGIVPIGAQ